MPIIPGDKFQQFLPAQQQVENVSIRGVAQVEGGLPDLRGVQSMAQVAADVSQQTLELGKLLKAQERDRQLSSAASEFNLRRTKAEIEADKLPYHESTGFIVDRLEKDRDELANQITDTEARQRFSNYAVENAAQTISKVTWNSRKKEINYNLSKLFENIDKQWEVLSQNPKDYEQIEQNITWMIQDAVKNGLMDQDKAEIFIKGTKDKVDEIRIKGLKNDVYANRITPNEAIIQIENRKNFVRIDPAAREEAILEIRAAADHIRRENLAEEERRELRERQALDRRQQENRDAFTSRIFNVLGGRSKEQIKDIKTDILIMAEKRGIDGPQQAWLMNLADSAQAGPDKDDPAAYARRLEEITLGIGNVGAIAYDPNLTPSTRITLINKAYEINALDIKEKQANALNKIKSVIITSGPGAVILKGDEQLRYQNATIEFSRRIDAEKQKGAINFDQITDEIIWKYGNPEQAIKNEMPMTITTPQGPISYRPTIDDAQLKELGILMNKSVNEEERRRNASILRRWAALRDRYLSMPQNISTEMKPRGAKPE